VSGGWNYVKVVQNQRKKKDVFFSMDNGDVGLAGTATPTRH
jgi:hypothetical protein